MYSRKVLLRLVVVVLVVMLTVSIGGFGERVFFEGEKGAKGTHGEEAVSGGFYDFRVLELVEFGLECDGKALPSLFSEVYLLCQA